MMLKSAELQLRDIGQEYQTAYSVTWHSNKKQPINH